MILPSDPHSKTSSNSSSPSPSLRSSPSSSPLSPSTSSSSSSDAVSPESTHTCMSCYSLRSITRGPKVSLGREETRPYCSLGLRGDVCRYSTSVQKDVYYTSLKCDKVWERCVFIDMRDVMTGNIRSVCLDDSRTGRCLIHIGFISPFELHRKQIREYLIPCASPLLTHA